MRVDTGPIPRASETCANEMDPEPPSTISVAVGAPAWRTHLAGPQGGLPACGRRGLGQGPDPALARAGRGQHPAGRRRHRAPPQRRLPRPGPRDRRSLVPRVRSHPRGRARASGSRAGPARRRRARPGDDPRRGRGGRQALGRPRQPPGDPRLPAPPGLRSPGRRGRRAHGGVGAIDPGRGWGSPIPMPASCEGSTSAAGGEPALEGLR